MKHTINNYHREQRRPIYTMLSFCLLSIILLSCAASTNTTVSSTYTKPETNLSQVAGNKIMVFAMTDNQETRRMFELAYTDDMNGQGVASYTVFSRAISQIQQDEAVQMLQENGYQTAMIVRLVNQRHSGGRQKTYVGVNPNLYYGFGGGWSGGLGVNISPGYDTRDDEYIIESSLYDLEGNRDLLWSSTTVATNPDNVSSMANDVAAKITSQMKSNGILK